MKLLLFVVFLAIAKATFAQSACPTVKYDWSVPLPGGATSIAADTTGNTLVAGRTGVTKLSFDKELVWKYELGDDDTNIVGATALGSDSQGNIYYGGGFAGTIDFDPGSAVVELTAPPGTFVVKLTKDRELLWVRRLAGPDYLFGWSPSALVCDHDDNVVLAGGNGNIAIAKLSFNGDHLWNWQVGGTGYDYAAHVGVDDDNDIYISGTFRFTVDFDPGPGVDIHEANDPPAFTKFFVSKYTTDGAYLWTRSFDGNVQASDMAVRPDGDVVLSGSVYEFVAVDLDPTEGVDARQGSGLFLVKLNSDGSHAWTYFVPVPFHASTDITTNLSTLPNGDILLTGRIGPGFDFDPTEGIVMTRSSGRYLVNLDSRARPLWVMTFEQAQGRVLTTTSEGEIYLANFYDVGNLPDRDPTCGVNIQPVTAESTVFIAKLHCVTVPADADNDGDVDLLDLAQFQNCFRGEGSRSCSPGCDAFDLHPDLALDLLDFSAVSHSVTGPKK